MTLDIDISVWILCGMCLLTLVCAILCLGPWYRTGSRRREEKASTAEDGEPSGSEVPESAADLPSLSVVVYAEGSQEELDLCVERLEAQDYTPLQIAGVFGTQPQYLAGQILYYTGDKLDYTRTYTYSLEENRVLLYTVIGGKEPVRFLVSWKTAY